MKVFLVASEAVPYVKTGGLGDVAGSLPNALGTLGVETSLILPLYRTIIAQNLPMEYVMNGNVAMGSREWSYTVFRHGQTYFVAQNDLFDRDGLYNTPEGDFPDNWLRFAFFARAALETIIALGGADVVHVHDWQTALLPVYLRVLYPERHEKVLLTIHNIAYQGLFSADVLPETGLPDSVFTMHGLEFYGKVNYLKGGIAWSDRVNTVSPSYAREILTEEYGYRLDGILETKRGHLSGILNGIDCSYWNPAEDTALPYLYGASSLDGKAKDKEALLQETNLQADFNLPLFAMVSRLAAQKGVDLLLGAFDSLMSLPLNLVILGTGDTGIESSLQQKMAQYPGRFALDRRFDEGLAHRIYAASDFFLMPSRFEPCGLSQMIALRYGSIPVVRRTGGLIDTVQDVHPKTGLGNGISFDDATSSDLLQAVQRAVRLYADQEWYKRIQAIGMACDFSWKASAQEYLALYQSMEVTS